MLSCFVSLKSGPCTRTTADNPLIMVSSYLPMTHLEGRRFGQSKWSILSAALGSTTEERKVGRFQFEFNCIRGLWMLLPWGGRRYRSINQTAQGWIFVSPVSRCSTASSKSFYFFRNVPAKLNQDRWRFYTKKKNIWAQSFMMTLKLCSGW